MKWLLVTAALVIATYSPALAQTTATGTGTANSSSSSGAVAVGGAGSASANVIFNNPGRTDSRIRQSGSLRTTPNAIAPGLGAAGVETCYGPGVSGGLSVTGFGASFGAGQWDIACNRRLNARTLWSMGAKREALIIMANEPEVASAMMQTGMIVAPRYRAEVVVTRRASANSSGFVDQGCRKWAGGNIGGQCLY